MLRGKVQVDTQVVKHATVLCAVRASHLAPINDETWRLHQSVEPATKRARNESGVQSLPRRSEDSGTRNYSQSSLGRSREPWKALVAS